MVDGVVVPDWQCPTSLDAAVDVPVVVGTCRHETALLELGVQFSLPSTMLRLK